MIRNLLQLFKPAPVLPSAPKSAPKLKISPVALARSMNAVDPDNPPQIEPYDPPPGVLPPDKRASILAMDNLDYSYVNASFVGAYFKGFPYLALLSQKAEYRKMSERIAKEMTRKWIRLTASGDDDKTEKLVAIEAALKKYKVADVFREAAEHDGLFGRGQIFIDVSMPGSNRGSSRMDDAEIKTPLLLDPAKIKIGGLVGIRTVEPMWTYPSAYNSDNPLAPDFYKPGGWYVMGREVHRSRLLTLVSRELPDMLKPAYNFAGLSMSQIAEDYVEHWLRTRDSVSETVHTFSTSGIRTNMGSALSGGDGTDVINRAQLFTNMRDNRGVLLLDKEQEEFFQYNAPLGGLDALQAQSQEQMASVSNIPLVILLGITPQGLNASSEGEIAVFYDYILSMQEHLFRDPLETVLKVIQLSEFGEIDPNIGFEFEPLWQSNDNEMAAIRKLDADTGAVLIGAGVISPDEERARLANDPDSGYVGIEVNDVPADPELGDPDDPGDTD